VIVCLYSAAVLGSGLLFAPFVLGLSVLLATLDGIPLYEFPWRHAWRCYWHDVRRAATF